MDIAAIPTKYGNVQFRSRLEDCLWCECGDPQCRRIGVAPKGNGWMVCERARRGGCGCRVNLLATAFTDRAHRFAHAYESARYARFR